MATKPSTAPIVVTVCLALAAGARTQDQALPPGAESTVLDIVFKVEDIGGRTADFRVTETDTEMRIELAADVLFDFDKATLRPEANDALTKISTVIRDSKASSARIEGHTDSKGDDVYNQKLSERRAESVRRWLLQHGLGGLKFSVAGFGEARPAAPNTKPDGTDDPEGRQRNRRVEIVIAKQR